jgi:hypothetical protein
LVIVPLVPSILMVEVPVVAVLEAVTVTVVVAVPLAAGVTEAGEKEQPTPAGRAEQERLTGFANPFTEVTVQLRAPIPPCSRVSVEGLQAIEKVGWGAVIVSERPTVFASVLLVASTLIVEAPTVAVLDAETVRVVVAVPLAAGVTEAGEKEQLAPEGRAEQARLTAVANPFCDVTVQVLVSVPPCRTDRLVGVQERAKLGGGVVTVRLIASLFTRVPLVPRTEKASVPAVAVLLAERVIVVLAVPLAAGVTLAGEKEQLSPAASPTHDMLTALANPPTEAIVQTRVTLPPCWTEMLLVPQETVKSGGDEEIVRETPAVRVRVPTLPSTLMVEVPAAAVPVAEMVTVVEAVPSAGGVTELGEKAQLPPVGMAEQEKATALEKPSNEVTVQVTVPLPPCWMVSEAGLQLTL